jgi:hypothetical protein
MTNRFLRPDLDALLWLTGSQLVFERRNDPAQSAPTPAQTLSKR